MEGWSSRTEQIQNNYEKVNDKYVEDMYDLNVSYCFLHAESRHPEWK